MRYANVIYPSSEVIRNLSIAFVGNGATPQSRIFPVEISHPLLFLWFISFPEGVITLQWRWKFGTRLNAVGAISQFRAPVFGSVC